MKIQSNYSWKAISKLNLDYATVFSLAPYMNENVVTIVGVCLVIGAMAKSSQIGLHVWLPMAMEGPTPVSALIHAATMVTAGVYILMRSSPVIEYSSTVLMLCLWLGAITTVFSSLIGLFQQDIKKVIAYSTMSQLGMMVIAVGLSSYNVALFHLVNHALNYRARVKFDKLLEHLQIFLPVLSNKVCNLILETISRKVMYKVNT